MQASTDLKQRPTITTYSDRFNSFTTVEGLSEFQSTIFDQVSSFTNPRPWVSARPASHSYRKIAVMNGARTHKDIGTYILRPYVSSITSYGRWNPGLPVYSTTMVMDHDVTGVEARAYTNLLDRIRGTHANLAVDFAERRQTVKLLKDTASLRGLVKKFTTEIVKSRGYKKIRKGPTQGQRRLDYVNGKWLEYRYGWMPLLSSIYSVVEQSRKRVSKPVIVRARAASAKQSTQRSGSATFDDPVFSTTTTGGYRVQYTGVFDVPSQPSVQDWTSLNPLSVAWELVPFSFVVDWFVGVGQCLENWENWFLYRNYFRVGCISRSTKEARVMFYSGADLNPQGYYYAPFEDAWFPKDQSTQRTVNGAAACTLTRYTRDVLYSLPTPGGPQVKNGLNPKRMLDSAALLSQMVRKFR
jgi:hypothetical protein